MPPRVLLVDDAPEVLSALRRALKNPDYSIVTCSSGQDAMAIAAQSPIDVVVSDLNMPGMSGIEFLSQMRERFPDTIRIILSGTGDFDTAIEAINRNQVYRFLTKPCDAREIALSIQQALLHKRLLDENRRLIASMRRQRGEAERMEREISGLTRVVRDDSGAIILDGLIGDFESMVRELHAEVEQAERFWNERPSAGERPPVPAKRRAA